MHYLFCMQTNEFSGRLAAWRSWRGLSLRALASTLGVSQNAVHTWERGEGTPRDDRLPALYKALGVLSSEFAGPTPAEARAAWDAAQEGKP